MVSGNDVRKETRAALSQVVICHSVRNRQKKAVSAVLYNKIDRTLNKCMRSTLSMPCLIGSKHAVYSVDAMLDWFASADQFPVNMFTRTNIFR